MNGAAAPQRRWQLAVIPVIAFAALSLLFWRGLSGNPSEIPSALIGKPVPEFSLPPLDGLDVPGFDAKDLRGGHVTIVNVWASWCGPCRTEHRLLMELAKRTDTRLFGINYKDDTDNARQFLGALGQPFAAVGRDDTGRVAVDWGVYGVPETFIIDGAGTIRFKWIGPLTAEALSGKLAAEIARASGPVSP